jgi:hypothetical protein
MKSEAEVQQELAKHLLVVHDKTGRRSSQESQIYSPDRSVSQSYVKWIAHCHAPELCVNRSPRFDTRCKRTQSHFDDFDASMKTFARTDEICVG